MFFERCIADFGCKFKARPILLLPFQPFASLQQVGASSKVYGAGVQGLVDPPSCKPWICSSIGVEVLGLKLRYVPDDHAVQGARRLDATGGK